jgi:zona occludens toxin
MFKLVTGSPGDGKTSNELWAFLHDDQYKNRPKFCTPINGFKAAENGVTEIADITDWQSLPDGSAIFVDEVQKYMGTNLGKINPPWVEALAEHRHRGFDFVCTTQSPMFLHPFPRKLAKPHVHYLRPWNLKNGARYTWETVQNDPTTNTAKKLGQREMVKANPKVFDLYTSTVLDTHKAKPPLKLIGALVLGLIVFITATALVVMRVKHFTEPTPDPVATLQTQAVVKAQAQAEPLDAPAATDGKVVWTEQTVKPRMPGNLYTAPIYDALTAPTDFPRVAACISSETRGTCNCYTQQGTPLDVPKSACLVYIAHSSFDPWLSGRHAQTQAANQSQQPLTSPATTAQPVDRTKRGMPFTEVADTSHTPRKALAAK